jgi:hypothetical protein
MVTQLKWTVHRNIHSTLVWKPLGYDQLEDGKLNEISIKMELTEISLSIIGLIEQDQNQIQGHTFPAGLNLLTCAVFLFALTFQLEYMDSLACSGV